MSEIKRCPFCGGEAKLMASAFFTHDAYVRCKNCGASTLVHSSASREDAKLNAIKAWNNRKPMQNIVERLEEEYHEIDKSKKESYENGDWERFDMFTDLNRGIYKAIAIVNTIVKEEGGIDE